MIDSNVVQSLKFKFAHIHPLAFHRSLERAKSVGDLFDILSSFDEAKFPIIWDENEHKWVYTDNLFQSKEPTNFPPKDLP